MGFQTFPRSTLKANIHYSFPSQILRHALNDVTTESPDGENRKKAPTLQRTKAYHA